MTLMIDKSYSQPGLGAIHIERPLTNISVAYLQMAEGFVAGRVFPNIPVAKDSDKYFVIDRGSFNRDEMRKRKPGTESSGGAYELSTDRYECDVWALHKDVPDQLRANQDDPLNLDMQAVQYLSQQALIRKERLWSDTFFKDGVWTTEYDGAASTAGTNRAYWNTAASNPIEDVRGAKTAVHLSTGRRPNLIVLGRQVFDTLLDHPDIVARINQGQTPGGPAMSTRETIAALFEVDEILVMDAIYNSAAQGLSESNSFVGGKHALLCYRTDTPGVMMPTAGYTFSWTGYLGAANDLGAVIGRFREERLKSDRIEIEMAFDMKKVSADLGAFFSSIIE